MQRQYIIDELIKERERQIRHGWTLDHDSGHGGMAWILLLQKQLGDISRDYLDSEFTKAYWEVMQLMAVGMAMLESDGIGFDSQDFEKAQERYGA